MLGVFSKMAASGVTAAVKGVQLVSSQWLWRSQSPAARMCLRLQAARCRLFHVSRAASLCSSKTESGRSVEKLSTDHSRAGHGLPEYIPQRKAKNPMMKIAYAWLIGFPSGIIGFFLARRQVEKNRLKQLKIRQRMRASNEGEYEGSRYRRHAEAVKLD